MDYNPPFGSTDPDAPYVDRDTPSAIVGSRVPAKAVELNQREIVAMIKAAGLTPSNADLKQLAKAIQSQKVNYAVAGGSANALTCTLDPAPSSLTPGMRVRLLCPSTNTSGAVTIQTNGGAAIPVYRRNSTTLAPGDIKPGLNDFAYDGTQWRLMAAGFGQSVISGNGWIDLPGGLTLQWGTGATSAGTVTLNWPKTFSANPYICLALDFGAASWSTSNASFLGISALNPTGGIFRAITWNGTGMVQGAVGFNYQVLGPT
ncbi:gp53-like domain-containing protein [Rhizobium tumorigenes]|uniref:gp53-like domain-containing protein n=1 Tax=Rhizobium tumorigenes TaxID=2041385 RepID=UPI00241F8438|nr:hypothetical protein [Rhizobium tumorigenes]WFS01581.1 hypothetical protein PR016_02805 [Rhizobium tumorigenes]